MLKNQVGRKNVGTVCFCKPWIFEIFWFFTFNFKMFSCDTLLCLMYASKGLITKNTWLGQGKCCFFSLNFVTIHMDGKFHPVLLDISWFCCHNDGYKMPAEVVSNSGQSQHSPLRYHTCNVTNSSVYLKYTEKSQLNGWSFTLLLSTLLERFIILRGQYFSL